MFKLQHLRFLVAVVDYGGVVRAAERLHLSQPSISAGLKQLEEELGAPLFERNPAAGRRLKLTPGGRRFYQGALAILQQCEALRQEARGESAEPAQVKLAILETLPQALVVETCRLFEASRPGTRLVIWEGAADRVAGWLAQGRVDLAWTGVSDLAPNARVLWRESLVAVLGPADAGGPASIACRDLAGQPFIYRSRCELDGLGRSQLRAAGVKLQVRARAERDEWAFELVRKGLGITLAPRSLVPADLLAVPVAGLDVERRIGLQWGETAEQGALDTVLQAIAEAAGAGGWAWERGT